MKKLLASLLFATGTALMPQTASAACGHVTIADMSWASASAVAWIDKIILSKGYGCDAELVTGDTQPTIASMTEKGQPDIAPELWINSARVTLDKAVADGKLFYAVDEIPGGAVDGWWIPKFIQDAHPELKTIADVLKRPDLFQDPEDKTKGGFFNCPAGWSCQISQGNLFKAYKAKEAGFNLIDSGSAAGLDGSIAKAFERKQGWLGYYWAPTAILGKYELVRLDPPAGVGFDQAEFDSCTTKPDCKDPKPNAPAPTPIKTVVTAAFQKAGGPAYDYLTKRKLEIGVINNFLKWGADNQATGEATAKYFLKTNEALWTTWVSPEAATAVKKSL